MNKLTKNKIISIWLYSGLIMVLSMVIIGGITRVTGSGLSMTEWDLFGRFFSENDMQKSFIEWKENEQNNRSVEYRTQLNYNDYKNIYFWENFHRQTGRFIGILFILPFLFFLIKKWISSKEVNKYLILLCLGALQAVYGYFMVKSGLKDNPKVSHYWLSIHFISALSLASYIWWMILELRNKNQHNKAVYKISKIFLLLLTIQLIYGAFSAGLEAGKYTNFTSNLSRIFAYSYPETSLNFMDDPSNIINLHRYLRFTLLIFTIYFWRKTRNTLFKKEVNILMVMVIFQIIFGAMYLLIVNKGGPIIELRNLIAIIHQFLASLITLVTVYIIHQSRPT